jgi:hypothetical protein
MATKQMAAPPTATSPDGLAKLEKGSGPCSQVGGVREGLIAGHDGVARRNLRSGGTLLASERRLRFLPIGVNVGESPTLTRWADSKTSREKFKNLRAELMWLLRTRFQNTHEHVVHGIPHKPEELISIPYHEQLIAELSMPLHFFTETGKVQIESKKDMRSGGVASPNFADALCLAFYPRQEVSAFAGLEDVQPEKEWHNPYCAPPEHDEALGEFYIPKQSSVERRGWFGRGRRYNRETQRYENG